MDELSRGFKMPTDAIKNAIARREALQKELAEIEQFLTLYNKFSGGEAVAEKLFANDEKATQAESQAPKKRNHKALKPSDIARLARTFLIENGRPMTRGELASAFEVHGYTIKADDKARHIGTVLWRKKDQFHNVEGKGYWLVGKPQPLFASDLRNEAAE